jgi:hypothetical protein
VPRHLCEVGLEFNPAQVKVLHTGRKTRQRCSNTAPQVENRIARSGSRRRRQKNRINPGPVA